MSMDETNTPQYIVTTPSEVDAEEQAENDELATTSVKIPMVTTKCISQSTRSQSLQSSSSTVVEQQSSSISSQLKAQSSMSIVTAQQQSTSTSIQKTSSTKSKFQSFLQHAEGTHTTSGSYLTAHQKHVRQFVRSTSAHSDTGTKPDKCIRSSSTQNEEPNDSGGGGGGAGHSAMTEHLTATSSKTGFHQSILISKSAETIEQKGSSAGMRTQLTLSGGFLAPPNRKLTILSPVHAPPNLQEVLKRHGRSPLSPRISFPGSEVDLFG